MVCEFTTACVYVLMYVHICKHGCMYAYMYAYMYLSWVLALHPSSLAQNVRSPTRSTENSRLHREGASTRPHIEYECPISRSSI